MHAHLVWATWDRLPLLTKERQAILYRCIKEECAAMGAEVLAIGGIEDHIHVLVSLPQTTALSALVKQIKGSSSHLANKIAPSEFFKWQGAYAAYAVEKANLRRIQNYIERQEEHHRNGTVCNDLELRDDQSP